MTRLLLPETIQRVDVVSVNSIVVLQPLYLLAFRARARLRGFDSRIPSRSSFVRR